MVFGWRPQKNSQLQYVHILAHNVLSADYRNSVSLVSIAVIKHLDQKPLRNSIVSVRKHKAGT